VLSKKNSAKGITCLIKKLLCRKVVEYNTLAKIKTVKSSTDNIKNDNNSVLNEMDGVS
jgi:hypothetical protein